MNNSWKTTIAGAVAALGTYLQTVEDPAWLKLVGQALVGLSTFLIGFFARDHSVSSEAAGIK